MENSIYLGLSRQMALMTNMDIVSNNIANMNTAGFRAQNPVFEEYLSDPRYGDDPLSFVTDYGQYDNTTPGTMSQTNNPLNVALNGPGFLGVQMPSGETGYTRDGTFMRRADGMLLSSSGYPIMGQGGPITIPAGATEIIIDKRGMVSDQNGEIAQLMVVEFENVQDLRPNGNNTYTTDSATKTPEGTTVEQGFLEGSNVNPIVEMTRMVEILRGFQNTQKLLETEHDRMRSAIQKLSQA